MAHVMGQSRDQATLFAEVLDDLLPADHVARVMDAFVDGLDLARLGFSKVEAAATGRPPYEPGDLLKLYLYGYLNQVRSSRRLEREARRNVEVFWLINRVAPSFKTIADFRKDHAEAIIGVCRAFIEFCRGQALLGGALLAIDGTKVAAVASRKKVITPAKLAKRKAALDTKIAEYLAAMDEADRQEPGTPANRADVKGALAALQAQREAVQRQAEALSAQGLSQRVLGEEDARLMRTAHHGHQVAYNAQIAVDARHHLVAAFDLSNEGNDERLLHPMAEPGKQALQAERLTVVADTGYSNGAQGELCEAAQITAVVPRARTVNPTGERFFGRDRFTYHPESDSYVCPAGARLSVRKVSRTAENKAYGNVEACRDCALTPQCTRAAKRTIVRSFHQDAREAMHRRATADPQWMRLRRSLVEHPFGTMKWMMGYPRFLVRGLRKARAELALTVLSYNLKRVVTILGPQRALALLRAVPT